MDSTSWNQESWSGLAAGLGGNFKPRLRACLLALGNLLWPLTWQKCEGLGMVVLLRGEESSAATLRAYFFPCQPPNMDG